MIKKLLLILFCLTGKLCQSQSFNMSELIDSSYHLKSDTQLVQIQNEIANKYRILGNTKLAKKFSSKAINLSNEINWDYGKALSYNSLSYINIYESDFINGMANAVKALKIGEENNDLKNLGNSYLYIGYINLMLSEMDDVLPYYNKSLEIRLALDNPYDLGFTYSYIGNYYNGLNISDSALHYHHLALTTRLKTNDIRSIADSYLLIGGVNNRIKEYDTAHSYMEKALEKYVLIADERRLAETYRNLSEVSFNLKEYSSSKKYLKKSKNISEKLGAIENLIPIYNQLSIIAGIEGNYYEAYNYLRKNIELEDSIGNDNVYREATKEILKYKSEKEEKIKELEYQKTQAIQDKNNALLKVENKNQQYILIGASLVILFLIIIAIIINKNLKVTTSQKIVMANQNKEIKDSISYAKRIQEAILPSEKTINALLPNSFLMYSPKDIVAGDFYWVEEVDDLVMFAVADCTGHGVPGAMVSVVCHNAMSRAIREFKCTEPHEILNKTRELVISRFAQGKNEINDGMDIALCTWNKKTNKFHYSGAYNPLWIVRLGKEGVPIIQITKADKHPIGKFLGEEKAFTLNEIELEKGDVIYLFSDGFADQFGGPKDKKFSRKRFKNLLLSIHDKSMNEQNDILNSTIVDWMENSGIEQIDDICVMGVKI